MLKYLTLLITTALFYSAAAQNPIGQWNEFLSYRQGLKVALLKEQVFVATPNTIFIYHQDDNSIERITPLDKLSDVSITAMETDPLRNLIIVGYQNGNLDLLYENRSVNIPDIKNSPVSGSKMIRNISIEGNFAYLSTGVGIIQLNLEREEISETFGIVSGTPLAVNQVAFSADSIYAATNVGLYAASKASDLTLFNNWMLQPETPQPLEEKRHVVINGNKIFLNVSTGPQPGLYYREFNSSEWLLSNALPGLDFLSVAQDKVHLGVSYFLELKDTAVNSVLTVFDYNGQPMNARDAVTDVHGNTWIADGFLGLVQRRPDGSFAYHTPRGPGRNNAFKIDVLNDNLWIASGMPERQSTWNNSYIIEGFYGSQNGTWTNFVPETTPALTDNQLRDIAEVKIDPDNPNHVFVGSWFGGIAEVLNGEIINVFTEENSTLGLRTPFSEDYVGVAGLDIDADGVLWASNAFTEKPLSAKTPDGTWYSFGFGGLLGGNNQLLELMIDSRGNKWILRKDGGILVFNENETLSDPSDDKAILITQDDGLPSATVFAIAEDLDGEIWLGTAEGIAVIYAPGDIFSDSKPQARQILIQQDGNYEYLLETQAVSAISVDGANRKWIGTFGSGVFLMSEDGTEEIRSFKAENSPLISNMVNDIGINHKSGQVYFATDLGVVSYQSDASVGAVENTCTTVYPNPVRENYHGPIAIEGLTRNTEVKITDVKGNLIFSTRSNGGTAIWDGRDLSGNRVATGVYFALSTNTATESGCVSKILVIR